MNLGSGAPQAQTARQDSIARGKYLVEFGGCNDCHTPGYFFGKPDASRHLAGSDVGFEIPQMGVFVGPNLTPDKDTGLGNWSKAQIITALQTGVRPDGRILSPNMPWRAFARLTKADAEAIADYLKSLPPVRNKAAGPFGPDEKVPVFVLTIRPPAADAQPAR
ncbi:MULTISPECIES: cytochrome c [Rhodomicrobium]|uniref:c-type cytochrome n=1 Tax=Rhodomicrobium TaxID=1068 RepID=UPI001FD88FCD|nr:MULTISPECIES: cytochrome c [Rhodomicrobium]